MDWLQELIIALVSATFLLITGIATGKRFFKLIGGSKQSLITNWAVGWGIIGYIVYFLGQLHWLSQWSVTGIIIILALICHKDFVEQGFYQRVKKEVSNASGIEIAITLIIALFVTLYFIVALAPAIKFDDLWYHLTESKIYLLEGQIRAFLPPAQLGQSSVTPRLIEMLYTTMLGFNIHNSVGPKLIHFFMAIGSIIGMYQIGSFYNRRTGFIAALLLTTTPVVAWLSQTAYIDLGTLFYGVVLLLTYEQWKKKRIPGIVLGIVLGLFLATKLWVLLFIPALIADALYRRIKLQKIIHVMIVALIVAAPWFIEAYIRTGNPVYPVFSGPTDLEHLGGATSIRDWFTNVYWDLLPKTILRVIIDLIPWLAGLWLICLYPRKIGRSGWELFIFSSILLFLWSIIPVRDERYLLVFAVPGLLLVARLYDLVLKDKITAIALVIPSLGLLLMLLLAPYNRVVFYDSVVSGRLSKDAFLHEYIAKNIWNCSDKNILPSNAKKLLVFCHNMFYIQAPFADGFDVLSRNQFYSKEDLLSFLQGEGYSHIYVKAPAYSLASMFEVAKLNEKINDEWVNQHFKLVYSSQIDNTTLYELK